MNQDERRQVIADLGKLLDEVFTAQEFVTTSDLARELRKLGSLVYASRSDAGMSHLIGGVVPASSHQKRVGDKRFRGYSTLALREALKEERPECCRPESAAYRYRHFALSSARGKAAAYPCAHCTGRANDWATAHGSCPEHDIQRGYVPLCRSCHRVYDLNENPVTAVSAGESGTGGILSRRPGKTEKNDLAQDMRDLAKTLDKAAHQLRGLAARIEE
jgi:hypothetical protein